MWPFPLKNPIEWELLCRVAGESPQWKGHGAPRLGKDEVTVKLDSEQRIVLLNHVIEVPELFHVVDSSLVH